jgi:hypothetical protein
MTERTFGIKTHGGPEGPYICFGRIKRDPVTMRLMLSALEGGLDAYSVILHDDELYSALERLMVAAPRDRRTSLCGPMFWSFKKAVEDAIGHIS